MAIKPSLGVLLALGCIMCTTHIPVGSLGIEISLDATSSTTACIRYRSTSTSDWGYSQNGQVTDQTAEFLCRSFVPEAISGAISSSNYDCYFNDVYVHGPSTVLDCPYSSTSNDNCTITGSATPTYQSTSFYGDSIRCIITADWASTFRGSLALMETGGTYGTDTGRTLALNVSYEPSSLRPDSAFKTGTICMPTTTPPFSNTVAQALCRSAGLPSNSGSMVTEGTYSNADQRYISNIQCSGSDLPTLWNGGCTYNTTFYGEPAGGCSPYRPKLYCPVSYEMRLAPHIESTWPDNGFQELQLRAPGTTEYTGTFCPRYGSSQSYAQYIATAVCAEMYGTEGYDFSVSTYTRDRSTPQLEKYFTSLFCPSSSTSLSQCNSYASSSDSFTTCTNPPTLVACKISQATTKFTLEREGESAIKNVPGYGYLAGYVRSVFASGAVCSNGFNQAAALAACRSLGYTPGPSATYTINTTSVPSISFIFNNVTCPIGADKLTDCKLQYSGLYHRLSTADASVCGGRVLLDCDLGTPTVQFRLTTGGYAQARLYSNSEWGWVETASVARYEAYDVFCSRNISSDGNDNITGGVLRLTGCPHLATEYTQCTVSYLEGAYSSYSHYKCSDAWKRSSSSDEDNSSSSLNLDTILGVAIGVPVGILIVACLIYYIWRGEKMKKDALEASRARLADAKAKLADAQAKAAANRKPHAEQMSDSGGSAEENLHSNDKKKKKQHRTPQQQHQYQEMDSGTDGTLVYGNNYINGGVLDVPTNNNTWHNEMGPPIGLSSSSHINNMNAPPAPIGGGYFFSPSQQQQQEAVPNNYDASYNGIYGNTTGYGGVPPHQPPSPYGGGNPPPLQPGVDGNIYI